MAVIFWDAEYDTLDSVFGDKNTYVQGETLALAQYSKKRDNFLKNNVNYNFNMAEMFWDF